MLLSILRCIFYQINTYVVILHCKRAIVRRRAVARDRQRQREREVEIEDGFRWLALYKVNLAAIGLFVDSRGDQHVFISLMRQFMQSGRGLDT